MVSKSKLYTQLDALEAELKDRLIPHLHNTIAGNNDLIFCVKGFNPFNQFKHHTDKTTEELVAIGAHILALKEKLQEPSSGSIAERICWYCYEWNDRYKHDKSAGVILAKQFLAEI
jgi:hypothetical protein